MSRLRAIAAVSENGVIGRAGGIPWHVPADFRWFRSLTWGGVLVQGRKTFESIGKPLPGRETWLVSRSFLSGSSLRCFSGLDALRAAIAAETRPVWLCGGGELYHQMLPECSDLLLSRIHRVVEGDSSFPRFTDSFRMLSTVSDSPDFRVEHWIRIPAPKASVPDPH